MSEPDNPMPQTTTQGCITCGDPVRIPVEHAGEGPVKHEDCPAPNHYNSLPKWSPSNDNQD